MNVKVEEPRKEGVTLAAAGEEPGYYRSSTPPEKGLTSCERYELLIKELEKREPEHVDFDRLAKHELACPTGRHTEAGVERELGLPRHALREGSPEHGLLPARQLVARLIDEHLASKRRGD